MDEKKVRLSLRNINKVFYTGKEEFEAVEDVSLDVYDNEFLVLLGPGHCGKSVLLNIMDGLDSPTGGTVFFDGNVHSKPDPKIGMVFQKTGLMPWKTVMQNVELGLKFAGMKKEDRQKRAQKYIELVGLKGFENHYPSQLSGGMKQRVGIARAYASDPQILLMDEPFGALDAQTRYAMEEEINRLWEMDKRTVVFVTNNIEEAVYLGDRILLLSGCPATVKRIYEVNLPRPRDFVDPYFMELRQEIAANTDLAL